MVTTSAYPDQSSTTTITSTSTSCRTITACTGLATTISTTTSSATTIESYCEPTNCGSACAAPARRRRSFLPPTSASELEALFGSESQFTISNATLEGRSVRAPGSGDWSDFYSPLKADSNTITMQFLETVLGTETAVVTYTYAGTPRNILVEDLHGCIVVIGVSHQGKDPAKVSCIGEIMLTVMFRGFRRTFLGTSKHRV